jgi:integrase
VDTLGDNLTKSLVVILYYCGFRISEATGDGDRKWKVLSVEGRALSKQKKLPDNWMDGEYENKLWWWRRRSSSLPGIVKEDIKVQDGNIYITSKPLKHGKRTGSLELPLSLPMVDLVVNQWKATPDGAKVWPITQHKAWRIISSASGGKIYPHSFRNSRATSMASSDQISIRDMMGWFGWSRATTADNYIFEQKSRAKAVASIVESVKQEV